MLNELSASDLLLITADHGCDPDPVNPTTDHSREYVPILAYSPGSTNLPIGGSKRPVVLSEMPGQTGEAQNLSLSGGPAGGGNLGVRQTLADMGQTVAANFGAVISHGTSFLGQI